MIVDWFCSSPGSEAYMGSLAQDPEQRLKVILIAASGSTPELPPTVTELVLVMTSMVLLTKRQGLVNTPPASLGEHHRPKPLVLLQAKTRGLTTS